MRLSVVFELLLIFLIIAFAAYGRVVPENKDVWNVGLNNVKEHLKVMGRARQAAPQAAPPNRYCACSNLMCNCCRDFSLPVVPIKGPGCASLKYLKGDQMAVTMSFGDRVLRNTTISGKKPKPVCMALPGGISKFCGRVYGISRDGDQFKACLGLELRALDDVEAALRVSCFRFGPQGMKVEPAQPLPASETLQGEDEDDEDDEDDDDDDDDYGLGGGSDDDDAEDDDDDAADEDAENDVESTGDADYTGLSALSTDFLDSLFGGGGGGGEDDEVETTAKPTAKPSAVAATTATKSKVTAAPQQVTEKHGGSAESVTSTSYTVSVVQDASSSSETSAEARPTAAAPLDDSPTDRVETVPTPAADKRKDYEDDEDEDDDDDDDEDGDIVSDIIETAASAAASAASAVGMADATADQNSTVATATTKAAAQVTTEAATTAATGSNGFGPAGKDYDDDDEDDDDGFRSLKRMPAAIVPNDRRGRTHRRMRLSSSDDESTIHFMRKV